MSQFSSTDLSSPCPIGEAACPCLAVGWPAFLCSASMRSHLLTRLRALGFKLEEGGGVNGAQSVRESPDKWL